MWVGVSASVFPAALSLSPPPSFLPPFLHTLPPSLPPSLQEECRQRVEEVRRERREAKMREARQAAIRSLHQKREERKREGERIAREEIVSRQAGVWANTLTGCWEEVCSHGHLMFYFLLW